MKITNQIQFATLVAELEKNPSLAKGFHRGNIPTNFKRDWDTISNKLNASGPPMRDGDGWQKVWRDLKCKIKKKITHNKAECRATGGGAYKQFILSPLEEAVANLLKALFEKHLNPEGIVQGVAALTEINDENVPPPVVEINMDEQPSTSAQPLQEMATSASRKRKRDDGSRQSILEKHDMMQERVLTEISSTLTSLQKDVKALSRYQRKLWEVEEKKLKVMQRAQEREEHLYETEMKLKNLKMEIKESPFKTVPGLNYQ